MHDTMLLESPPPSRFTFVCDSPVKTRTFAATFSTTRTTRIPRIVSRIYPPGFQVMKPRLVTGTSTPPDHIETSSPIYKFSKTKTYFEQCFRVVRQIGKGEFGEALEVESVEDGKRYAIKRSLRTFESTGDRQLKLREATLHESIPAHSSVVRFEKAWEERGRLYIQTELCGANLADYRRHFGILREGELYLVMTNCVMAIDRMHSVGLLHMDVKPSNIFVSEDGVSCKLGDFGLAFNLKEDPLKYAEEGDRNYLAPEVLNNPPTTAADIYSLGVTFLELSTDVDLEKDKEAIRSGAIREEWFKDISRELIDLIKRMVRPNPRHRPSAAVLLEDLRQLTIAISAFRHMEIPVVRRSVGSMDKDWDFDLDDATPTPFIDTNRRKEVKLRLNFDEDDQEDNKPVAEDKHPVAHRLVGFSRRLSFQESEAQESKPLKRRRLVNGQKGNPRHLLVEFKLGTTAKEADEKINAAFDESLEEHEGRGRHSDVDEDKLRDVAEEDPHKGTREIATVLGVSHNTAARHLKEIGKTKKLERWLSEEQRNRRYER
ncbi:unnamed protein product [Heligmosomoides polygyrus]|uniref:non-specific serine/threonine protein kinase n=1 Tax=Heligmosomoides polygyrus TaxID=6339 RepID=A0A3P7WPW7_HELPZ|nr:unnamed protein product [Heligmosomoides polygyrus]